MRFLLAITTALMLMIPGADACKQSHRESHRMTIVNGLHHGRAKSVTTYEFSVEPVQAAAPAANTTAPAAAPVQYREAVHRFDRLHVRNHVRREHGFYNPVVAPVDPPQKMPAEVAKPKA